MGIQGGYFEKPLMTPRERLEFIIPEDPFENPANNLKQKDIIDFMDKYLNDLQVIKPNQEVMGSKEQVFPRYANPEDGTLNNEEMARVDPTDKLLLDSLRRGEIGPVTDPRIRKAIVDLERKIYNDGRASSFGGGLFDGALMAADPSFKTPVPQNMVGDATERLFPGYKDRRDSLRQQLGLARMKGFV